MKNVYNSLQVSEMVDFLWLYQASEQLKRLQCNQLAELFEKFAYGKLHCAMHMSIFPYDSVELILSEAAKMFENDYQNVYVDCGISDQKQQAIQSHRKAIYLKLVDLLHDCVNQEELNSYCCIKCGYTSKHLDEYCPICHANQSYFMKQE